jgi:hypothetical protein
MRFPRPFVLTLAVLIALALLAAGCGATGSRSGVASLSTVTTSRAATPQSQRAALVVYSRCMRSNGVHGFPDPPTAAADARPFKDAVARIASSNPHFTAAQSACSHLLPPGSTSSQDAQHRRAQLAAALSFAQCMRRRGLSRFPDPNGQGELTVAMVVAQGIDVNSPQVLRIVQACLPASHGWLTPAKVRQALDNYRSNGH